MNWKEVQNKPVIYLNLGGRHDCHPKDGYENYIAVDLEPGEGWSVEHDLRDPIPLPNNSVARIHTEDFIEHLRSKDITNLLVECFRLLKPRARMRIATPDYNNPKDRRFLQKGFDPRYNHITLLTREFIEDIIEESPFSHYKFYHFWDGDHFVCNEIDYSLGMVKRTPDNDPMCRRSSLFQKLEGILVDTFYKVSRGFRYSESEILSLKGNRLYATSLVVDVFKE